MSIPGRPHSSCIRLGARNRSQDRGLRGLAFSRAAEKSPFVTLIYLERRVKGLEKCEKKLTGRQGILSSRQEEGSVVD